jgi:hypothetical protein
MRPISLRDHGHLKFNCVVELYHYTGNLNTSAVICYIHGCVFIRTYAVSRARRTERRGRVDWNTPATHSQDPRNKFRPRDRLFVCPPRRMPRLCLKLGHDRCLPHSFSILDVGTRWGWVVSFRPRPPPALPPRKLSPSTTWIWGLDAAVNRQILPLPRFEPRPSSL